MSYAAGQIVTFNDSAYIAVDEPTGQPGTDPAWRLLARGVPEPTQDGYVLTVQGDAWVAAPAPESDGGGGGDVPAASETEAGVVELATAEEATTGTDTERAVTPAALAAALSAQGSAFNLADAWAGDWVQP